MQSQVNLEDFYWINKPETFNINNDSLCIQTEAKTDFWQRTYYGFQHDNAPAYLVEEVDDFTFTVKAEFEYLNQYDQCGIILYRDSENWIKASIELENDLIARLGSVVTNLGYSDWATNDISSEIKEMWYRLSRRGQDFFIEYSEDGVDFIQMRILHMHKSITKARFGVYACSPLNSSFEVTFSEIKIDPCSWELHN